MIFDFTFEADPRYASAALRCLLRRRLGRVAPLLLVVILAAIWIFANDPYGNPVFAYLIARATLMLLLMFLLAVQACNEVVFYQGWQYFAIPTNALPPGSVEFADERIASSR